MKFITALSLLSLASAASADTFVTNSADADAFVRALAPGSNYGGGGALSISGTSPQTGVSTNGAFDSFIRFNTAADVAAFDSIYGVSNWVVTSAVLNLTQNQLPGNPVFNYGTGAFAIRWIANDNWTEGSGTPNAPDTNGITYADESSLLNTNTDTALGTFSFSGVPNVVCGLTLAAPFVADVRAGGEVGFYLTAVDPSIGFVFYSHSFMGQPAVRPSLVISAMAQPVITGVTISGANLILSATNGVAGATYTVLSSTNISMALNQWLPVTTNVLPASGSFSITVTNAAPPGYFVLQAQ